MSPPADWSSTLVYLSALAFGYLLGSIPFGLILARIFGLGDLRKIGSGNIGATNVLRAGSKWLAALTLFWLPCDGARPRPCWQPWAHFSATCSRYGFALTAAKALPPSSVFCSGFIGLPGW